VDGAGGVEGFLRCAGGEPGDQDCDEIFFSITQKKVLSPDDFASLGELSGTLLAFADHYNQTARPFSWKCTSADLARLLDKINGQQQTASPPQAA
jgi:hypothetical protein